MRDGRLVGGILMGDISKAAYLMQAFDRDTPLPEERLSLLFDLGAPTQKVTFDEMPAETQVCNCNGVSKGAIGACVAAGKRSAKAVMDATRAGMGCGSCKAWSANWSTGSAEGRPRKIRRFTTTCPSIPLTKPELVKAVRERGLKSVSAVFAASGRRRRGRGEQTGAGLAADDDLERGNTKTSATPASSTTASTPISRRTARSR